MRRLGTADSVRAAFAEYEGPGSQRSGCVIPQTAEAAGFVASEAPLV